MRRLKRFTTVSILLFCALRAVACGPGPNIRPDDCDLYRILPYYAELREPDDGRIEANCRAWMKAVKGVPYEAVRQAIYDFTLADWLRVQQGDARGNAFCRRLIAKHDSAAVQLLVWSKFYEQWSEQMRSPWYYGCGMDDCELDIDSVCIAAQNQRGRYADRYLLLAMKCLYRSGRSEECIALWSKRKAAFNNSHLREQAEGYLAACLNRTGHRQEAIRIYARLGDAASLQLLLDDRVEVFEQMLRNKPNSPFFPIALQRVLFVTENYVSGDEFTRYELDSLQLRRLAALAQQAGHSPRVRNQAMWLYTAACLLDHLGERRKALALVENLKSKDDFLNTSIRVLRLHLHAQLDNLDADFDRRLMTELKWLDRRMQTEWKALDASERFRLSHVDGFGYDYDIFRTVYANDALRRIVLSRGGLADRMARSGRTVRALQLANMADNRFIQVSHNPVVAACRAGQGDTLYGLNLNDVPTYNSLCYYGQTVYVSDTTPFHDIWKRNDWQIAYEIPFNNFFNSHDFSNGLFTRADRMKADAIARYWQRVEHPCDNTDRWLNERGYTDKDYWCDIIGTHFLREMRFGEASKWLARVDKGYHRRLNTKDWMVYNPYKYEECAIPTKDREGYKQRFATTMCQQEAILRDNKNPDDRADAMLNISIGIRNAFSYRCWPLVAYGYYSFDWMPLDEDIDYSDPLADDYYQPSWLADDAVRPYVQKALERAAALRKEAFATYVTPERKAKSLRRVYEFTYLMEHYANTPTGQDIARHCDQWKDYRILPSPPRR